MDVSASLTTSASPDQVFEIVSDLTTYPRWLDIVASSVRDGTSTEGAPAWTVDLRGQIGPLRRSKRLRMVRTRSEAPTSVVFERSELDGRRHSPWVMSSSIGPHDEGSEATISLHYGGQLWLPLLDRLLEDEIDRAKDRLRDLLADT